MDYEKEMRMQEVSWEGLSQGGLLVVGNEAGWIEGEAELYCNLDKSLR